MIEILNRDVGRELEGGVTTEHADCIASPLKEYLRITELDFSEKTQKFSVMIRNGFMSRDEASTKAQVFESEILQNREKRLGPVMEMLDVSEEDLAEAVKKRQRPYIPKSAKIFGKLIGNETLMRKLIYRY